VNTSNGAQSSKPTVVGADELQHRSRVRRKDGDPVVTGRGVYLADIDMPGMLHLAVLRNSHPHARVVDVRTERASVMPGAVAALIGEEAAHLAGPISHYFDQPRGRPYRRGAPSDRPARRGRDSHLAGQ